MIPLTSLSHVVCGQQQSASYPEGKGMQFEDEIHELIKTERHGSPAFYADCDARDATNQKSV
jgi:hypothetical protein